MSGAYPQFQPSSSHDELVEHFLLTPADLQLVLACRGEANRCGMALLLKALTYLGYVPDGLGQIPAEVRAFVAGQLGLLWDHSTPYPEHSRTWDQHLFLIRQHTGWRFPTAQDKADLAAWLRREATFEAHRGGEDETCKILAQGFDLFWGRREPEFFCDRWRHMIKA